LGVAFFIFQIVLLTFRQCFFIASFVGSARNSCIAIAGSDYSEAQGTLNWNDGDADAKTFPVTIIDDHLIEGNETLIISGIH
jgi:hypothetical protein